MFYRLKTIVFLGILVSVMVIPVAAQAILQDATALLKQDFFTDFTEDKTEYLGILKNYPEGTIKITNSRNRQTAVIKLIPYSDELNIQPNTLYLNEKSAEKIALSGKSSFVDIVLPNAYSNESVRDSDDRLFSDDDTGDLLKVNDLEEEIEDNTPVEEEISLPVDDKEDFYEVEEEIKDVLDTDIADDSMEEIEENILPDWLNTSYEEESAAEDETADVLEDSSTDREEEPLIVNYDTKYDDSALMNLDDLKEDLPDLETDDETVTALEETVPEDEEDLIFPNWTNDPDLETDNEIVDTEDMTTVVEEESINPEEETMEEVVEVLEEDPVDNEIVDIIDDIIPPFEEEEIAEEEIFEEEESSPVLVELTDEIPELEKEDKTGVIYFLEPSDFRPPVSGGKQQDNATEEEDTITVLDPVYEPVNNLDNLGKGLYYLQSAAFSSKTLMEGAVDILKNKGMPVFTLEKKQEKGGVLYKVLMGPFTRDEIGVTVYQLFYSGYQDLLIFKKR